MAVRTTVHLDDALLARARRFVPPRGLNRFINEALAEKLDALEREQVEGAMKEGYLATQGDRLELDANWHLVDVENWLA